MKWSSAAGKTKHADIGFFLFYLAGFFVFCFLGVFLVFWFFFNVPMFLGKKAFFLYEVILIVIFLNMKCKSFLL